MIKEREREMIEERERERNDRGREREGYLNRHLAKWEMIEEYERKQKMGKRNLVKNGNGGIKKVRGENEGEYKKREEGVGGI